MMLRKIKEYFSVTEIILWGTSVLSILISFFLFDRENFIVAAASLIGVTSLIFNAKGNPFGQILMIVFSLIYGAVSFDFRYYGEMITYIGMTMPMAVISLVSWLRNPYNNRKFEVKVNRLSVKELPVLAIISILVTFLFYFVLRFFGTENLVISTFSVTTSFIAAYLTFRRSPYFALAYASNDIVLIILWILASMSDISYICVVVCFIAFLANDIYGYISWQKMKHRQNT